MHPYRYNKCKNENFNEETDIVLNYSLMKSFQFLRGKY